MTRYAHKNSFLPVHLPIIFTYSERASSSALDGQFSVSRTTDNIGPRSTLCNHKKSSTLYVECSTAVSASLANVPGYASFSKRNEQRSLRFEQRYSSLNMNLFHTKNWTNNCSTLIYSCIRECGGWGDRQRGLESAFLLALITDRRFMIEMNFPCDIRTALQPN
ncbi:unnamed protein product [Didymodactylos carnosus]|uniref:Uncharacterized protein n=1 Tax=Didymodactylos carnosus TaxID=1234261 RepID=A0A815R897_9BILA|nr:unnamed protein product [Didymodactylos carnosus]CAF4340718.1 unnamed protein product [Didymodactylos carnosus]